MTLLIITGSFLFIGLVLAVWEAIDPIPARKDERTAERLERAKERVQQVTCQMEEIRRVCEQAKTEIRE
jgi:hypothetical protein